MQNPYLAELGRLLDSRFNIDSDDMTPGEWLCKNTKLKGKAFSFARYPFQRALADETARRAVTVKPSQVGVSEIYQRIALMMLMRARHRKGIYSYPDDEMRKKNVQTRVAPLAETKAFAPPDKTSWVRSIQLIQLGTSYLYMTGSKVGDATSTDADFVFLDEYDLHDMANAALFSSRLLNSDWGFERYFSTRTYMEYGVDALYAQSDQMEYLVKCDSCNHWQFPLFSPHFVHMPGFPSDWNSFLELTQEAIDTHHIDLTNSYVCCEKCRSKLDLGREDNRSWVAKYPSRVALRGRRVNPFSVSSRSVLDIVAELLKYKTNDFIRGFKNSVLGEAEDSSNNRLQESHIRQALRSPSTPPIDKDAPTWLGCDMGHTCHLVVGQGYDPKRLKVITVEQVPLSQVKDRIRDIKNTYNLISGMVDRHPESQVAADIWELTGGVVVPGEYRGEKEMNLIMVPGDDEKVSYVQINRTLHLDQVARAIKGGHLEIEGYGLLGNEILLQLRNMIRIEQPEKPAVWNKLSPNDHFFHSLGFMFSAMKLKPYTEYKIGPVLTMLGFATADMTGYDRGVFGKEPAWQTHSESLY